MGTTLLRMENIREAMDKFSLALCKNPTLGWAYFARAQAYAMASLDYQDESPIADEHTRLQINNAIDDLTYCIETLRPELKPFLSDLMSERAGLRYRLDNNIREYLTDVNHSLSIDAKNPLVHLSKISACLKIVGNDDDLNPDAVITRGIEDRVAFLFQEAIDLVRGGDGLGILLERRYDCFCQLMPQRDDLLQLSRQTLFMHKLGSERIH
ncbi:hypothetical protein AKO1_011899 [Acrasis kona]|uniref:Tetratricopeptide repeat protein n=1 Tax=Acrasis kona TaxID=1008807 RepID=A0AAW2Z978_9EUKA